MLKIHKKYLLIGWLSCLPNLMCSRCMNWSNTGSWISSESIGDQQLFKGYQYYWNTCTFMYPPFCNPPFFNLCWDGTPLNIWTYTTYLVESHLYRKYPPPFQNYTFNSYIFWLLKHFITLNHIMIHMTKHIKIDMFLLCNKQVHCTCNYDTTYYYSIYKTKQIMACLHT